MPDITIKFSRIRLHSTREIPITSCAEEETATTDLIGPTENFQNCRRARLGHWEETKIHGLRSTLFTHNKVAVNITIYGHSPVFNHQDRDSNYARTTQPLCK